MYLRSLTSHVIFRFHLEDLESSLPVQRSFQSCWFGKWQWLHYDVAQDAVRYFTCCKAVKDGRAKITGQAEGNFFSERSSALRRIKTYLCTTMTQQHLNHLMLLHVNKEKTDALDLLQVGRDFVAGREG